MVLHVRSGIKTLWLTPPRDKPWRHKILFLTSSTSKSLSKSLIWRTVVSVLNVYLTSTSTNHQLEVEDRSSSHLEGGQDDHIFTEMFASRKELLGREMWEESEGSPGDEGGDFLEVHRNLQVFTSGVGCQLGKSINRTVRCWIEFNQFLNITFTLWIIIL